MKIKVLPALLLITISILGCNSKHELGDYLYMDGRNVVHADNKCDMIYRYSSVNEYSIDSLSLLDKYWVACPKCLKEELQQQLTLRINECRESRKRDIRKREREYRFLRSIKKDEWGNFEQYYKFISQNENEKQLEADLANDGLSLGDAYIFDFIEELCVPDVIIIRNETYCKWLYINMVEAGIDAGTYKEFCSMLENKDDFVWFYDKALSLGLTESWSAFIMMLYDSDCDGCKETHWDEWMAEFIEEQELYEEMRHDALYDPDIEDERLYDHY